MNYLNQSQSRRLREVRCLQQHLHLFFHRSFYHHQNSLLVCLLWIDTILLWEKYKFFANSGSLRLDLFKSSVPLVCLYEFYIFACYFTGLVPWNMWFYDYNYLRSNNLDLLATVMGVFVYTSALFFLRHKHTQTPGWLKQRPTNFLWQSNICLMLNSYSLKLLYTSLLNVGFSVD